LRGTFELRGAGAYRWGISDEECNGPSPLPPLLIERRERERC
jgi:hypothetical protein